MTFALTVRFVLRPGALPAFLPLVEANAATSVREEPGCLRFDVCTPEAGGPGDGDEVFLYELYEDAAAFDAHLATPHFLAFDAATRDLVADKRVARLHARVHAR